VCVCVSSADFDFDFDFSSLSFLRRRFPVLRCALSLSLSLLRIDRNNVKHTPTRSFKPTRVPVFSAYSLGDNDCTALCVRCLVCVRYLCVSLLTAPNIFFTCFSKIYINTCKTYVQHVLTHIVHAHSHITHHITYKITHVHISHDIVHTRIHHTHHTHHTHINTFTHHYTSSHTHSYHTTHTHIYI